MKKLMQVKKNQERLWSDITTFESWMNTFTEPDALEKEVKACLKTRKLLKKCKRDDVDIETFQMLKFSEYKAKCAKLLQYISWDAIVNLMNDDIRENVARRADPTDTTMEDFFAMYALEHFAKYGEEWELAKENSTI